MKWIVVLIIVVGIIAWGGILEDRAESNAKDYCDSVNLESSFLDLTEKAKSVGEDRLRIIREESILVGFTGIPPFSRHFCEILREGEAVGGKHYYYLD